MDQGVLPDGPPLGDVVHEGPQVHRVEGLAHIGVGPDVQAVDLGSRIGHRGQEHDGDGAQVGVLPQGLEELETIHHRHHDVADDEVEILRLGRLQALLAVGGAGDVVPLGEHVHEVPPQVIIVLDHQDVQPGDVIGRLIGRNVGDDAGIFLGTGLLQQVVGDDEPEDGALRLVLRGKDAAAMGLDQLAGIVEADAEAADALGTGFIGPGVLVEDLLQLVGRNALPVVFDDDFQAVGGERTAVGLRRLLRGDKCGRNGDLPTVGRVLDGVVQQVGHHASDLDVVVCDLDGFLGGHDDGGAVLLRGILEILGDFRQFADDVLLFQVQFPEVLVDLVVLEQLVGQTLEFLHVPLHDAQLGTLLVGQVVLVKHVPERDGNERERRAELVGEIGEHVQFHLVHLADQFPFLALPPVLEIPVKQEQDARRKQRVQRDGQRTRPGFPEDFEGIGLDHGIRGALDLHQEGVLPMRQDGIGDVLEGAELPIVVKPFQLPHIPGLQVVVFHQGADEDEGVVGILEPVRHIGPERHRNVVHQDFLDAEADGRVAGQLVFLGGVESGEAVGIREVQIPVRIPERGRVVVVFPAGVEQPETVRVVRVDLHQTIGGAHPEETVPVFPDAVEDRIDDLATRGGQPLGQVEGLGNPFHRPCLVQGELVGHAPHIPPVVHEGEVDGFILGQQPGVGDGLAADGHREAAGTGGPDDGPGRGVTVERIPVVFFGCQRAIPVHGITARERPEKERPFRQFPDAIDRQGKARQRILGQADGLRIPGVESDVKDIDRGRGTEHEPVIGGDGHGGEPFFPINARNPDLLRISGGIGRPVNQTVGQGPHPAPGIPAEFIDPLVGEEFLDRPETLVLLTAGEGEIVDAGLVRGKPEMALVHEESLDGCGRNRDRFGQFLDNAFFRDRVQRSALHFRDHRTVGRGAGYELEVSPGTDRFHGRVLQ